MIQITIRIDITIDLINLFFLPELESNSQELMIEIVTWVIINSTEQRIKGILTIIIPEKRKIQVGITER